MMPLARNRNPSLDWGRRTKMGTRVHPRTKTNLRTIRRTKTSLRNIRTRNMVTRSIRRRTRSTRTKMMGHLRPAAMRIKARRSITDSGAVRKCYCQLTLMSMFRAAVLMHDIYCVLFPCCS
ncbi:hypothetical protein J4Q44_G00334820 [Coregonus suidteri]|uniref:Uncharacterized protein n=1 Tax=Coregonus suidteri TaxID=861788 RepID=A0AAN8KUU2_9TELE